MKKIITILLLPTILLATPDSSELKRIPKQVQLLERYADELHKWYNTEDSKQAAVIMKRINTLEIELKKDYTTRQLEKHDKGQIAKKN